MVKSLRTICCLILLCSIVFCNGIYAADDAQSTSVNYVGAKDYLDENEYDISIKSKCYVDFENGILNIYAGKKDQTGTVNGSRADLDLPYTNVTIKEYPYLAIRIKTEQPGTGGVLSCFAGRDKSEMKVKYNYADTTDWQTVVIDFSSSIKKLNDDSLKYFGSVKLQPFASETVSYGAKVSVDSFAFFSDKNAAAAFTGSKNNYAEEYAAQNGLWLSDEFINPAAGYKMMKLLYQFDRAYENKIEELYEGYGYGGVTTNVAFNEKYLKDIREFDLLDTAFAHALKSGMTQLWIYDEYQWPSGSAYGQVLEAYPEGESIGVAQITTTGTGNSEYTLDKDFEDIVYAVLKVSGAKDQPVDFDNNKITINASGKWELYVYATYKPYVDPGPSAWSWDRLRYVNIMDKDAIKNFIQLTHDRYKANLDESFSSVTAFFTDEPALRTTSLWAFYPANQKLMPWEDSLPEVFSEMHGYSILDNMTSLFEGDSEWDKAVRVNFYQTVGSMVAEAYFKQIEDWCKANGVASSGHPLLEERLSYHVAIYGDLLACLNEMGIPGCDLLWIDPTHLMSTSHNIGTFQAMKFASSAARNYDRPQVMVEYNPEAVLTDEFFADPFGESLGGATLTLFFGADTFVMLNPQESYNAWQARQLNEYVGRINTIIDNAVMNSGVAVYYPITSTQAMLEAGSTMEGDLADLDIAFNELCKGLIVNGLDYNYLDESTIQKATLKDGKLISGKTEYSVIVMPFVESMSTKTMEKLGEFENQGGRLIWVNNLPSFATDYTNKDKLLSMVDKYKDSVLSYDNSSSTLKAIADKVKIGLDYGYTAETSDSGVFFSPLTRDGKQMIFIANSLSSDAKVTVSFGEGEEFSVYDPYTGVIKKYTGSTELDCEGFCGLLVVNANSGAEYQPEQPGGSTNEPGSDNPANPTSPTGEDNDSGNTLIIVIAIVAGVLVIAGVVAILVIKKKKAGK